MYILHTRRTSIKNPSDHIKRGYAVAAPLPLKARFLQLLLPHLRAQLSTTHHNTAESQRTQAANLLRSPSLSTQNQPDEPRALRTVRMQRCSVALLASTPRLPSSCTAAGSILSLGLARFLPVSPISSFCITGSPIAVAFQEL
jgi:hypothetical protein